MRSKVKIVFVCGSLEFGRDGVGDHTRILAGKLIQIGYDAAIVAVNDKNIQEIYTGSQYAGDVEISILRLPATINADQRVKTAKQWITNFDPVWLSLQFVPYAFNNKGLPFDLGKQLAAFGGRYKWHIMFHELWIGVDKSKYFKSWIISRLQQYLIAKLIGTIQPAIIHTHLPEFKDKIKNIGYDAKILLLFSNVNIITDSKRAVEAETMRVAFFSQAQPTNSLIEFLKELKINAATAGIKLAVTFIGGDIEKMKKVGFEYESLDIFDGGVTYTGFLNEKDISTAIQACTLGVTPIPRHALGKSGSVAAFLAHGVPVAAPNIHQGYRSDQIGFDSADLRASIVIEPRLQRIADAKKILEGAKKEIQAAAVAAKFSQDISKV